MKPRPESASDGVSWRVAAEAVGVRLDKFLATAERLGSRGRVVTALDKGQVFVNDVEATRAHAGSLLKLGDVVRLWRDRPGSARRRRGSTEAGDVEVLYEDDALLVVNKPAGLLSVPLERKRQALSAYDHLEEHLRPHGKRRPLVVHRIDRDTSGLVVFAKTLRGQDALKEQFRRRDVERVYWAVVYGHPTPSAGTWRDHLVWDTTALIQKETSPGDPRGGRRPSATTACSRCTRGRRCWKCASKQASGTRYACRRGSAVTRSSASGVMCMVPIR